MPKMMIFFSGSDMTWEDTTFFLNLGATERHNLREPDAPHYYYFFDGPAASSSPEHKAVESIKFDEKSADFMQSKTRKVYNLGRHFYQLGHGSGMDHTIRAAFKIIEMQIKKGIFEFDLMGFSRGGSSALSEGALIKKLEKKLPKEILEKLKFNIIAIDPVAGRTRNKSANVYGDISSLVKTCYVGLAVNESLPGFKPRDVLATDKAYDVKFHPETTFTFLPLPEDHLMTNLWMQDLVHSYIPENSKLKSPCNERLLIERKLDKAGFKWYDKFGETATYRMVTYFDSKHSQDPKESSKYQRHIFPTDEKENIDIKNGIENYFKGIGSEHKKINIGHISLQNDADSEVKNRVYKTEKGEILKIGHAHRDFKQLQIAAAKKNQNKFCRFAFQARDRHVKEKLTDYTNYLFVNLLHEAMFQKSYPVLHHFLLNWDIKDLDSALLEINQINEDKYPLTKDYIYDALEKGIKLRPIEEFKSTNAKSVSDILNGATLREIKVFKEEKEEGFPHTLAACCFANILVKESEENAKLLFSQYAKKYFTQLDDYQIIYTIYKRNKKTFPKEFSDLSKLRLSKIFGTHISPKAKAADGERKEFQPEFKRMTI